MENWVDAINGVGTLIVAVVVAFVGYRQFRSDQLFKDVQTRLLQQDLRIKLLSDRSAVIEDYRLIQAQHFRAVRLDQEGIQTVFRLTQRAALLFGEELSTEIDKFGDALLSHEIVTKRVAALLEHDPNGQYHAKLDEQFELEDRIFGSLTPLLENLITETRVHLD